MQEQGDIEKKRERRRLKKLNGICIDCNKPAMDGKSRCEKHYHEHNERAAAWSRQQRDLAVLSNSVKPVPESGKEPWWRSFEENYTHEKLEALNGRYHSR